MGTPDNGPVNCYLYHNENRVMAVAGSSGTSQESFTNSALIQLKAGDEVELRECTDPGNMFSESSFTGFLVNKG